MTYAFQKRRLALNNGERRYHWIVEEPDGFSETFDNEGRARAHYKRLDHAKLLKIETIERK